jgi:hypothetical protein
VSEAFFHVAADALNWCRISRANPLPLAGLREPFLTERSFRSPAEHQACSTRCWAAEVLDGGPEPDLLEEVAHKTS